MKISEVKIGQMVKRTGYEHQGVNRGVIREIIEISEDSVKLNGSKGWHDPDNLDLVSDVVEKSVDIIPSLKHTDIIHGLYYHISYNSKPNDWVIMKTESQDDPHRWTGPTIKIDSEGDDPEFEDGTSDEHGAYFGGEEPETTPVKVRYATGEEIGWLNECINAGELEPRKIKSEVVDLKMTKIWVGGNDALRTKVLGRLKELGCIGINTANHGRAWGLFINSVKEVKVSFKSDEDGENRTYFNKNEKREISLSDIGIVEDHRLLEDSDFEEVVRTKITPGNITPEIVMEHLQQLVKQQKQGKMDKYITQITPDMVGQKIKCRIDGIRITDAKIQLAGDYYICQDVKEAMVSLDTDNRFGYKHAWSVGTGSSEDLQHSVVSGIEIIPPQFKEGDYVMITGGGTPDMEGHIGKIAFLKRQTSSDTFKIDLDKDLFSWKAIEHFTTAPGIVAVDPKKLEAGEIYVYGDDPLILRAHSSKQLYCDKYIKPRNKTYDNSGGSLLSSSRCRTATDKEKAHLKACIDASKYVDPPKEEELLPVSMDIDPEILAEILAKA